MPARMQSPAPPRWHARFLTMLPIVQKQLRFAFRRLRREAREEAIQEGVANALVAFRRLVLQGRLERAFPQALARFAAAQVREGRQVGTSLNINDVLSRYSQRKKQYHVERLDRFDPVEEEWVEAMVEDSRTPVADQVCFRIDFSDWLTRLSPRRRRITLDLAAGESTGETARKFRLSPSRISQLRRELEDSWRQFQGELAPHREPVAVAA